MISKRHFGKDSPTKSPFEPGSINSHYFHIIGDGKLNPIVGVYIPIIRIPIEGGMTIPNIATFDHGTFEKTHLAV